MSNLGNPHPDSISREMVSTRIYVGLDSWYQHSSLTPWQTPGQITAVISVLASLGHILVCIMFLPFAGLQARCKHFQQHDCGLCARRGIQQGSTDVQEDGRA